MKLLDDVSRSLQVHQTMASKSLSTQLGKIREIYSLLKKTASELINNFEAQEKWLDMLDKYISIRNDFAETEIDQVQALVSWNIQTVSEVREAITLVNKLSSNLQAKLGWPLVRAMSRLNFKLLPPDLLKKGSFLELLKTQFLISFYSYQSPYKPLPSSHIRNQIGLKIILRRFSVFES